MAKAAEAVEAAIAGEAKLDARTLRADFPIFQQRVHGKPLAYLESAVSAQKPRQVLDALRDFYETSYTNVHRGVYLLAERGTERFEGSREKVRAFINAASTREIVFTRSATEVLNLVAYAWGLDNLGPGDVVVATCRASPDGAWVKGDAENVEEGPWPISSSSFSLRTDATSARVPPSTISMC